MYSLVLSHINDYMPVGQAMAASIQVVFWNGVGAIVGPILASAVMGGMGPVGYFWTLAVVHAVMGFFIVGRIVAKEPIPQAQQRPWRRVSQRSNVVVATLGRRRRSDGQIDRRRKPRNGKRKQAI
jgi:MFS family permease